MLHAPVAGRRAPRVAQALAVAHALAVARALALLPLALAAPAAAQQVRVVGPAPGPGVDFIVVQEAIDASAPGDVVLLLPGDYAEDVNPGKELVLLGVPDGAGAPPRLSGLHHGGKASGEHVAVRGIRLASAAPGDPPGPYALSLHSFDGVVYVEDSVTPEDEPGHRVDALGAERLVLVRCAFTGRNGSMPFAFGGGPPPTPALEAAFTKAALYETRLVGGRGNPTYISPLFVNTAQPGAAGASFGSGGPAWSYLAQVVLLGGAGGAGAATPLGSCLGAAPGGAGTFADSPLRTLGGASTGGDGGEGAAGCPDGAPGPDLLLGPLGTQQVLGGTPRRLLAPAIAEPGARLTLRYEGVPGEQVLLLVGLAPDPEWIPAASSVRAVDAAHRTLPLGAAGPDGVLELHVTIPPALLPLPGGGEAIVTFLQAAGVPAPGAASLSNPTLLALLDVP